MLKLNITGFLNMKSVKENQVDVITEARILYVLNCVNYAVKLEIKTMNDFTHLSFQTFKLYVSLCVDCFFDLILQVEFKFGLP